MDYFLMIIGAIFVNNILLAQYLGNCPFLGCSKDTGVASGMAGAVIFVCVLATTITWIIQTYVLNPFGIGYLQTIFFIVVIASLVQFVELFLKKAMPGLYSALGIFLPLITTNCAVLGIAILCQRNEYGLIQSLIYSFAAGLGFGVALLLMAGVRERLEVSRVPMSLEGTPGGLVMAGLMALSFLAFKGMI